MSFAFGYPYAVKFHEAHGHLRIPSDYTASDGYPLGQWAKAMRAARTGKRKKPLTPKQIRQLEELGFYFSKHEELWENNYQAIKDYAELHGSLNMPQSYQKPLGTRVHLWLERNLLLLQEGKLPEAKRSRLEVLGAPWVNWLLEQEAPPSKTA